MSLRTSLAPGAYGGQIVVEKVVAYTGTPKYQQIISCGFANEAEAGLVTVAIGEARDVNANDINPAYDAGHLSSGAVFSSDWEWNEIKCVVEWERGLARYSLECDPGCMFVIPATSVTISARTTINSIDRYLSASVTRGAAPHVHPPKYTAGPNQLERVPAGAAATAVGAGANRFRIPRWARTFRVADPYGYDLLCVLSDRKIAGAVSQPSATPIWCNSWDEVHPVPYGANNLYVYPAGSQAYASAVVEFQLAI